MAGRTHPIRPARGAAGIALRGRARDELDPPLQRQQQIRAQEVADLGREVNHRRRLEARRHLHGAHLAGAAGPADAAADAEADAASARARRPPMARPKLRHLRLHRCRRRPAGGCRASLAPPVGAVAVVARTDVVRLDEGLLHLRVGQTLGQLDVGPDLNRAAQIRDRDVAVLRIGRQQHHAQVQIALRAQRIAAQTVAVAQSERVLQRRLCLVEVQVVVGLERLAIELGDLRNRRGPIGGRSRRGRGVACARGAVIVIGARDRRPCRQHDRHHGEHAPETARVHACANLHASASAVKGHQRTSLHDIRLPTISVSRTHQLPAESPAGGDAVSHQRCSGRDAARWLNKTND